MNNNFYRWIYDSSIKLLYICYFPFFPILLYDLLANKLSLLTIHIPSFIASIVILITYYLILYFLIKNVEKIEKVLFPEDWKCKENKMIRRSEDDQIMAYVKHVRNSLNKLDEKQYLNKTIQDLVKELDRIPMEKELRGLFEADNLSFEIRRLSYVMIEFKTEIVNNYGSFINALAENGFLVKEFFGVRVKAKSGNICFSNAELVIDNWLYDNKYEFEKEPYYPYHHYYNRNSKKRADWKVEGLVYIEYYGMIGHDEYDHKVTVKKKLSVELGLIVIEVYEKDINNIDMKLKMLDKLIKSKKQ